MFDHFGTICIEGLKLRDYWLIREGLREVPKRWHWTDERRDCFQISSLRPTPKNICFWLSCLSSYGLMLNMISTPFVFVLSLFTFIWTRLLVSFFFSLLQMRNSNNVYINISGNLPGVWALKSLKSFFFYVTGETLIVSGG